MKQDSRAAAAAFLGSRFIRPRSAAAFAAVSSQQASDDGGRAADSRLNADCARRAVLTARAAFHARVEIYNHRVFAIHFKYMVWADLDAHAAAGAFFFVHLKGCDTFQIREISHFSSRDAALRSLLHAAEQGLAAPCSDEPAQDAYKTTSDAIQPASPKTPADISSGKAKRISFFTPDSDV